MSVRETDWLNSAPGTGMLAATRDRGVMVGYEKPTVTRLGTLAELTLTEGGTKAWGGSDGIVFMGITVPIHTVS